ncbi:MULTISPECIES: TolC family protein [unclassified Aliiroseovarius]|uniref:TolC family protein n=2 Tax=unclassified Aliiroseovarius TaxID=2623558 RepID=UPI00156A1D54
MRDITRIPLLVTLVASLSGCMGDIGGRFGEGGFLSGPTGSDEVTRSAPRSFAPLPGKAPSEIISKLQFRQSLLKTGTSYDQVARSALAASARPAEAELRAAKLRARAADKNWLPTLGPRVSLSSLGDLVASIVVDQVIFDNGRKKAEREFARADVEAAAVSLSIDTNDRVSTALGLYLSAQAAQEKAAAAGRALGAMREFDRIMTARVKGGVSDISDQSVIRAKLSELQSLYDSETLNAKTAMAELKAMSAEDVSGLRGLDHLPAPQDGLQPLTVLLATAELDRDVAQAKIDRAGLLPGLGAQAVVAEESSAGLVMTSDQGFGFGTLDNLAAVKAAREGAERRILQAQEDSRRRQAALGQKLVSQQARAAQAKDLVGQARANTQLFQRQFDAGQRTVMDVVGVVENLNRLEQEQVSVRYDIARTEVEIAREFGTLVDGDAI